MHLSFVTYIYFWISITLIDRILTEYMMIPKPGRFENHKKRKIIIPNLSPPLLTEPINVKPASDTFDIWIQFCLQVEKYY